MEKFFHDWSDGFVIAGALFGLAGSLLMANRYLNVSFRNIPGQLLFAFTNSRRSKADIQIAEWSKEKIIWTLRGLTLIGLGFVIQIIPNLYSILHRFLSWL